MRWLNWMATMLSTRFSQAGSSRAKAGRDEAAVHQRPGVVGEAGIVAGDQPAERDLHEGEHDEGLAPPAARRPRRLGSRAAEPHEQGHERGEEQAGERQVQRELDRRHRRHAGLQPRGDHDPSDQPLRAEQHARSLRARQAFVQEPPPRSANQRKPAM